MERQNFYAALVQLTDFYGITMQDEDFENMALHAWDHIGNKEYRLYTYTADVFGGQILLPCNADVIEGVFMRGHDYAMKDNRDSWDYNNLITESYLKGLLLNHQAFHSYGKLIPYERDGNTLHFKNAEGHAVHVVYKGVICDDKGLPYLNFKEVDAIAKYCAFITLQKKSFMTKDQLTFQMAQTMRQQWQSSVEDARVSPYLNQNDFDEILNVSSSWDRKRFGMSFKPLK